MPKTKSKNWDYTPRVVVGDCTLSAGFGGRWAWSSMLANCSANDAECLSQIRKHHDYRLLGFTWDRFCRERLGMHRSKADELIRQWKEFGPHFFSLREWIGITDHEYRVIRKHLVGNAFRLGDAYIPLRPEYAPDLLAKVRECVAALERERGARPPDHAGSLRSAQRLLRSAVTAVGKLREAKLDRAGTNRLDTLVRWAVGELLPPDSPAPYGPRLSPQKTEQSPASNLSA